MIPWPTIVFAYLLGWMTPLWWFALDAHRSKRRREREEDE